MDGISKAARLSMFHMLPSGGGARLAAQNLDILKNRFVWSVNRVDGAVELPVPEGVPSRCHRFPGGGRLKGAARLFAPWVLRARLRAFRTVCRGVAEHMSSEGDMALVHNSMVIAAPPVLDYLGIPSVYFCYEYPRHLYEKDCVHRTGSRLGDLLLLPLERAERREDAASMKNADRVVSFSPYMRGKLNAIYGVDSAMVFPGVDSSYFCPGGDWSVGTHLLSVGALWPFKGHDSAIRALSLLPRNRRPPLVIAADRQFPRYRKGLERLAERSGVNLSIVTNISDEHLRDLYRNAMAVLCFQINEPYGLVPLEAMACGRPVVARDSGGLADNVTPGENGLLFRNPVSEAVELVSTIIESPGLARTLGETGRSFVKRHRTAVQSAERLAALLSC